MTASKGAGGIQETNEPVMSGCLEAFTRRGSISTPVVVV